MSTQTVTKSKTSVASKVIVGLALASVVGIVAAGVATVRPKVRIEAPNGGEAMTQGTATTIQWTARNVSMSFDIYLQDCSSTPCTKAPIVKNYPGQAGNDGRDFTYAWDAKTLLAGGDFTTFTLKGAVYKILIYPSATPTVYDDSDEPFTFGGTIPVKCTDSDGGKEYNKKGETTGLEYTTKNKITKTDFCQNESDYPSNSASTNVGVDEFFCDGEYVNNAFYACPNGCKDGACLAVATCSKEGYSCDDANKSACCTGLSCVKGTCSNHQC